MRRLGPLALATLLAASCMGRPGDEMTAPSPVGDPKPAPSTPSPGTTAGGAPTPAPTATAPATKPAMPAPGAPAAMPAPVKFDWSTLTAAQSEAYLGKLAPTVVGRVLNVAERKQIAADKGKAIEPIVTAWVKEPGFAEAVRLMIEQNLNVSGSFAGVDFGLPGNLAAYLVKNDRPWSEIATAPACYDRAGKETKCDTGAPYSAGLLTTRAFMISRASRFNLTRSSALMKNLACRGYPMEDALQPRIDKPALIPMFQAEKPEEQLDDRARAGFGNGFGCYTCHGQFSVHAQLFVKFDKDGKWQTAATGVQDPKGELGRSLNGLMASHLKDPNRAKLEESQMFGKTVMNLAEAAKVMVASPTFLECQAHRFLDHVLGLNYGTVDYDASLFPAVAGRARMQSNDPTFRHLAVALFTEPVVVASVIKSVIGGSP